MKRRALVVDDEAPARQELVELLAETGRIEVVASCANAFEALRALQREKPELLFLDIQMPVLDGFALLQLIDESLLPQVIFVTAYDSYALKAFEENACDYLLKPVTAERLNQALDRLDHRTGHPPALQTALRPLRQLPCSSTNRIRLVDVRQVEYVVCEPGGIYVVTASDRAFCDLSLKIIEQRTALLRCHRQYLINLDQVDEIQLQGQGLARIRTRSGQLVPVSRRYLRQLRSHISQL